MFKPGVISGVYDCEENVKMYYEENLFKHGTVVFCELGHDAFAQLYDMVCYVPKKLQIMVLSICGYSTSCTPLPSRNYLGLAQE